MWVYAICEPAAATALDDLEAVTEGALLAVVSSRADRPDAWAHEQVVERLMESSAVLPMRFGTTLSGRELRQALAGRHDELAAALDTVRGRVELAVRAVRTRGLAPAAAEAPRTGRGYLGAKLRAHRRDEAAATALHRPLAAIAAAARRDHARAPRELLRASYLVDRAAVSEFGVVARRLEAEHHGTAVLCTGPWPPYSFVDAGE
jgi:hypothetical protein